MPEETVDARIAALTAAQQMREDSLAKVLKQQAEELVEERHQRDHYRDLWIEADEKLRRYEARENEIKPLVILELEDNEDVEVFQRAMEHWEIVFEKARFVGVLRVGRVEEDD